MNRNRCFQRKTVHNRAFQTMGDSPLGPWGRGKQIFSVEAQIVSTLDSVGHT